MNLNLKNKNALICGSTAGIGKATAMELADLGANITLIARNEDKLNKVLSELPTNQGQNHNYMVADFNDPNSLKEALSNNSSRKYHILLNNTGGPKGGPILNADLSEFTDTFSQHLLCNHLLVQAVVSGMKENGYGRIINIISTSVKQPIEGLGVSNTIRGAVANWSKTLASELGPFGITVNNVLPGATATERLDQIMINVGKKIGKSPEEASEIMRSIVPAKRFAQPEEIALSLIHI